MCICFMRVRGQSVEQTPNLIRRRFLRKTLSKKQGLFYITKIRANCGQRSSFSDLVRAKTDSIGVITIAIMKGL